MTGNELLDRLSRLARRRGLSFRFDAKRGKGSHGTIWLDGRFAVVPDLRHELKKGTLSAICRDLGLKPHELFER
jgi:mRNA interferase HicA